MYYPWVVSLGDQGVFQTLDSYISAAKVDMTDFYPNALNAFAYQGKQIGMPFYAGPSVCYLNKTAFDKAGVPLPTNDWTWDDLISTAQKLTKSSGSATTFGLAPISTGLNFFNAFIWENGGNEFSDDMTTSRLTEAPSVAAFQYAIDLIDKQHVAPTPAEMKGKNHHRHVPRRRGGHGDQHLPLWCAGLCRVDGRTTQFRGNSQRLCRPDLP